MIGSIYARPRMRRRASTLRRAAIIVALMIISGPLVGCNGQSDKAGGQQQPPVRVLTLVNPRSGMELQPLLQAVSTTSADSIAIQADSGFERDSVQGEADAVRLLQAGRADLGVIPSRAFDSFGVTSFDALGAPMEIDSMAQQGAVLRSDIPADMLAGLEPLGLVGIGILPGPMRVPAGITRPLLEPADYAGARIGVSPSDLAERSLRSLGAVPVETPFEGHPVRAFDGIENQVASIAANQYDVDVRWITANVGLWPRPLVLVANRESYANLTDDQRSMLHDAAQSALMPTMAAASSTEEAVAMCVRNRVKVVRATPAEISALRREFEPVYRTLRQDLVTADLLTRIDKLKTGNGPDPSETLDCGRLAPAPDSPSTESAKTAGTGDLGHPVAVDGNYVLHLTEADLAASGDDPEIQENWGELRLALHNGRFVTTQHNATACTWGYGSFSVRGDRLEIEYQAGGGVAPTHALNKPGERFAYRVSQYRGTMRWSTVPDAVSPGPPAFRPWVRRADGSARNFVDQRCDPPDVAFDH